MMVWGFFSFPLSVLRLGQELLYPEIGPQVRAGGFSSISVKAGTMVFFSPRVPPFFLAPEGTKRSRPLFFPPPLVSDRKGFFFFFLPALCNKVFTIELDARIGAIPRQSFCVT